MATAVDKSDARRFEVGREAGTLLLRPLKPAVQLERIRQQVRSNTLGKTDLGRVAHKQGMVAMEFNNLDRRSFADTGKEVRIFPASERKSPLVLHHDCDGSGTNTDFNILYAENSVEGPATIAADTKSSLSAMDLAISLSVNPAQPEQDEALISLADLIRKEQLGPNGELPEAILEQYYDLALAANRAMKGGRLNSFVRTAKHHLQRLKSLKSVMWRRGMLVIISNLTAFHGRDIPSDLVTPKGNLIGLQCS